VWQKRGSYHGERTQIAETRWIFKRKLAIFVTHTQPPKQWGIGGEKKKIVGLGEEKGAAECNTKTPNVGSHGLGERKQRERKAGSQTRNGNRYDIDNREHRRTWGKPSGGRRLLIRGGALWKKGGEKKSA